MIYWWINDINIELMVYPYKHPLKRIINWTENPARTWFCGKMERPLTINNQPIFAHRSNICCPKDWRLSDSKCWNGGHAWVKANPPSPVGVEPAPLRLPPPFPPGPPADSGPSHQQGHHRPHPGTAAAYPHVRCW